VKAKVNDIKSSITFVANAMLLLPFYISIAMQCFWTCVATKAYSHGLAMLYKQFPEGPIITSFDPRLHGQDERARRREVVVYSTTNSRTIIRHNAAVMLDSAYQTARY
jgi:hypothetical protein